MSNPTKYSFWKQFLERGEVLRSAVPKVVINSPEFVAFHNGMNHGAIISEKIGRGSVFKINPNKRFVIEKFFNTTFPNQLESVNNKNESVAMFRNSKASGYKEKPVLFIKGFNNIKLNGEYFDLEAPTRKFGISAFIAPEIEFNRICFVENKDVFLVAEKLLGHDYLYIHKYGRVGKGDVKLLNTNEILVFSDYDYIGLNEYLIIKNQFQNTHLFIPENFDELYQKYSSELPEKQTPSSLVMQSTEKEVVDIRTILQKENRFLEQQSLLFNL